MANLSARDNALLQYLFNPLINSPLEAQVRAVPQTEAIQEYYDIDSETLKEIKQNEVNAIRAAKAGQLEDAVQQLTQIIEKYPSYSSAFNNRAQVYRLLHLFDEAKNDLDKAISLCELPDGSIINKHVAKQSYAQRGFLYKIHFKEENVATGDLNKAASLGETLSAIEVNPVRTLCANMVSIMMKEQCGIDV